MPRTPKLSDLQLILLTTAAQRLDSSLLPPPDSVSEQPHRIGKAIASLIKRGLVAEAEVAAQASSWRSDAGHLFGAHISDAGREAIGLEEPAPREDRTDDVPAPGKPRDQAAVPGPNPEQPAPSSAPREGSKQALVIGLMGQADGATLAELVEATGWLPHTTRAALTGLRKKGHAISKAKRNETTCYHLGGAA